MFVQTPAHFVPFAIIAEVENLCPPMAPGCQLLETTTSVGRRFWGSSRTSNALAHARTLRFVQVIVEHSDPGFGRCAPVVRYLDRKWHGALYSVPSRRLTLPGLRVAFAIV